MWRAAEITNDWCPPDDLVVGQRVGTGDSSQMTVIGTVRLSPLGGIIVAIACVSAQLDMTIVKRGERNVIRVRRSDKKITVRGDCSNDTIESLDATCGDLNIEIKNT
jgi:hypothetical protein